ncbi:hypothetical protein BGX29_010025 [Mortierella sp. GBA35]|nr:hypothetical protein BGX29_010025 [Mortierella sp. GBA35]
MLVPTSNSLFYSPHSSTEDTRWTLPLFLRGPDRGSTCTPRHNKPELTLSIFVLIAIIVSYLPQYYRIFQKKSSDGLSLWFLILGSLSTTSSFFNIFVLQWGVIRCCSVVGPGHCTESILGITQLGVQFVMFNLIFILYMIYFPPHKKVSTFLRHQLLHCRLFCFPTRSFTWTLSILASKVLLGYFFVSTFITFTLIAAVGRGGHDNDDHSSSRAWLLVWAGLLGIIAAFLAMIQYIPQIIETYLRKSMGALSIPMMLIQTPGAILITVSLALRPGANWTTWISYAITALLQWILLGLCLFYAFQIRKRRALRQQQQQKEQEQEQLQQPLLLAQPSSSSSPSATSHPSIPIPVLQESNRQHMSVAIGESTPLLSLPA